MAPARLLLLASLAFAVPAAGQQPAEGAPTATLADELGRFIDLLGRVRSGDTAADPELSAVAASLCSDHDRCDAEDVAGFYLALDPEARIQGLADEAEFLGLRQIVVDAGRDGLPPGESWADVRATLERDLRSFAETVAARPDVTPAARAYALLARLEVQRVEEGSTLAPAARDALIRGAMRHARASLDLFERAGQVTPRLEPLWVLGRLERASHLTAAARSSFEHCLDLARRVGRDEFRELALLGLVDLARDAGDLAGVDRHLAAIARFRTPEESWPLAREHANRVLHADRPEEALSFLLGHAPAHEARRDEWHALLAACYLRTDDVLSARREIGSIANASGETAILAGASLSLAEGRVDDALAALDVENTADFSPQGRAEAAVLSGEAWLERGLPELAHPALEEALRLAESWRALRADDSGSVVGEWIGLHAVVLLAEAYAAEGRALDVAVLIEKSQSRRLRRAEASALDGAALETWAATFDAGLVTWAVGADASVVAHVGPQGAVAYRIARGRRALENAVRRLRESEIDGDRRRTAKLARELGETLFPEPLREILAAAEPGSSLLLLVHGPLEALPVSLLSISGEPVDRLFTPVVMPGLSVRAADLEPFDGSDRRWRLCGGPTSGGEPLLPGAARELAHVARLHPDARVFTGAAFRRPALEASLSAGEPLHIATHLVSGAACGGTRLAPVGLLLSDGDVLCAEDILALRPRLPLVVLTACETAGGTFVDGEGLQGVARAFLESGTRNLVVTLWPVRDDAAREFAVEFHTRLADGVPPSRAARAARLELRRKGRVGDWAAFRFVGLD